MAKFKINKNYFFFLRIIILCTSILFIINIVDFALVVYYLKGVSWYILIILFSVGIIRTWFSGIRWQLINPDITGQLNKWQYFRFMMMANAFNLIMPGALGGDIVRSAMTVNAVKYKKIDNVIAIIADRFIGLISIFFLGAFALIFAGDIPSRSIFFNVFTVIFLTVGVIVFVLTNPYTLNLLEKITCRLGNIGLFINNIIQAWKNALLFFKTHKKNVLLGLLMCLPIHLISFLTAYLLAQSLGINVSFLNISLIIALVWLITAVPITISGAGVRELSMIYLFSIYGVAAEPATALSIYIYIVSLLLGIIGIFFIIDWKKWGYLIKLKLRALKA